MKRIASLVAAAMTLTPAIRADVAEMEQRFDDPPLDARPGSNWFWISGRATKKGITADLEHMKEIGMSGGTIMERWHPKHVVPTGEATFFTDAWRDRVQHAVREADRLGLEVGFHSCEGISLMGGPWIEPRHSMKKVVWSRTDVSGGEKQSLKLPRPPKNFIYEDIAIYAFPRTRPLPSMAKREPAVQGLPAAEARKMRDGNPKTWAALKPERGGSLRIEFTFGEPLRASRLRIVFPQDWIYWGGYPKQINYRGSGKIEYSLEAKSAGEGWKELASFTRPNRARGEASAEADFPRTTAKRYRLSMRFRNGAREQGIAEIALLGQGERAVWHPRIPWLEAKSGSGFWKFSMFRGQNKRVPGAEILQTGEIRDVTRHLKENGELAWQPPEGEWTILRFGWTISGTRNHPTQFKKGFETDKLNATATERHFDHFARKVIGDAGPLAGESLTHMWIESWEARYQNWTQGFDEKFEKRRGYDPKRYLPALAGEVIESAKITERFLQDYRLTISDLTAKNFFGKAAELCQRHGLELLVEGLYRWPNHQPADVLKMWGRSDIPMHEFWYDVNWKRRGSRPPRPGISSAANAGHIYGKPVVAGEAFTSVRHGDMDNPPFEIKDIGDWAWCRGINKFVYNVYTHQPTNDVPGFGVGEGLKFHRNNLIWRLGEGWNTYLSRSQALLQSGHFRADIAYFTGAVVPPDPGRTRKTNPPGPGYRHEAINREILLEQTRVENGDLVLDSGMRYEVLVLPDRRALEPECAARVEELVQQGATVIGPKPVRAPGLGGYPESDRRVKTIGERVWGDVDGKAVTEHSHGEGRVIWGRGLADVFREMGLKPDFGYRETSGNPALYHIARETAEATVYFLSHQRNEPAGAVCVFRQAKGVPEFWDPATGKRYRARDWRRTEDGRTEVPVHFAPRGSAFIVFVPEEKAVERKVPGHAPRHLPGEPAELALEGPWTLRFLEPAKWGPGEPLELDELISWHEHPKDRVKHFSGLAEYKASFQVPAEWLEQADRVYLDLGEVAHVAEVSVNGKRAGNVWKPPYRAEVRDLLQPGPNRLSVTVANTMANRVIGDLGLPPDDRFTSTAIKLEVMTKHNYSAGSELRRSGLLGPVRLLRTPE